VETIHGSGCAERMCEEQRATRFGTNSGRLRDAIVAKKREINILC
jgi:hypothetical protein